MSDRLREAPAGTIAPAIGGGRWKKTDQGWWKWDGCGGTGGTYPRPGADWNGELIAPQPPVPVPADREGGR